MKSAIIRGLFLAIAMGVSSVAVQAQPFEPAKPLTDATGRTRVYKIVSNLSREANAAYNHGDLKLVLSPNMPKGVTAMIENDVFILPMMATTEEQIQLTSKLYNYVREQKKDGLPYQPACFNAGYRTGGTLNYTEDLGLQLIPTGC